MVPKGGISGFLWIEFVVRWSIICPLGGVFGDFFFPGIPKKTPTFFTISLLETIPEKSVFRFFQFFVF